MLAEKTRAHRATSRGTVGHNALQTSTYVHVCQPKAIWPGPQRKGLLSPKSKPSGGSANSTQATNKAAERNARLQCRLKIGNTLTAPFLMRIDQ